MLHMHTHIIGNHQYRQIMFSKKLAQLQTMVIKTPWEKLALFKINVPVPKRQFENQVKT